MTIKQFIEKATEGGWNREDFEQFLLEWSLGDDNKLYIHNGNGIPAWYGKETIHSILLDPLAWQAVSKVVGWYPSNCKDCQKENGCEYHLKNEHPTWRYKMHRMIDALAEGKTIEEFIKTL